MTTANAPNLLTLAIAYHAGGVSLVPCSDRNKRPKASLLPGGKWEQYQKTPADASTVERWIRRGCKAVAGVGGKVSSGLVVIDFDEARFYDAWRELVGNLADGLAVQRTGREGGGYQVWLRCPEPGHNDKLAWLPDENEASGRRCAVETRAEGGYALMPGSLHPSGRYYEAIAGDFADIPTVPQAVADALLGAARKLDEAPLTRQQMEARERAAKESTKFRAKSNGQVSVIDAYNQQVSIESVLEKHGYQRHGARWKRPGGKSQSVFVKEGRSFHHSGNDQLNDGFWHRAFDVFCVLEHGGDCKAAVKAAAEKLGIKLDAVGKFAGTKAGEEKGLIASIAECILVGDRFAQDAGGKVYRYSDGTYRPRGDEFIKRCVKDYCIAQGVTAKWCIKLSKEVVEFIRVDAPILWERPPEEIINLNNGLLRIVESDAPELLPHSPAHLSPVQLPVAYDPWAECPNIDQFIATAFPPDASDFAWEMAGWLISPITRLQKAVLLTGGGSNGKSVWLSLLISFIGKQNVSTVSLHALEANKFKVARLVGKLANVCADLPSEHLAGSSVFKALTGGDALEAERKFQDGFDLVPYARLVFSANHPPRSADSSDAFFRRWIVCPFDRTFSEDEQIPRDILDARLQAPKELSGLLNRALEGLRRLQKQGRFSESESMKAAWREFHATTDPLAVWLSHYTVDDPDAVCPGTALRVAYNAAAEREGRPTLTDTAFGRALRKIRPNLDYKQRTLNGRLRWCWIGLGLTGESQGSQGSQGSPYLFASRGETEPGEEG